MLANLNGGLMFVLMIVISVIAVAVAVGGVIWAVVKLAKSNSSKAQTMIILSFVSVVIAAVSWVMNFGWMRFFLTFLLIPMIHGIVYFLVNLYYSKYVDKTPKMLKLNMFFIITYLIAYLFMPDGADYGEMYFFFGLIQSNTLSNIANFISSFAVIGHIVLLIMQIVEVRKIKKNISENQ